MNTISALALDRLQSENERLRDQLLQSLAYQRELEAALLSAPLYRTDGANASERHYEKTKDTWANVHRPVLDRAARRFKTERDRVKVAVIGKMKVWHQRIGNLMQRQQWGDTKVRIPTAQEILERFMSDMATI